jgi:hypothetical protein
MLKFQNTIDNNKKAFIFASSLTNTTTNDMNAIIIIKIAFVLFTGATPVTADTYIDTQRNGSVTYVRNEDGTVVADFYVKDGELINVWSLKMEQLNPTHNEQ